MVNRSQKDRRNTKLKDKLLSNAFIKVVGILLSVLATFSTIMIRQYIEESADFRNEIKTEIRLFRSEMKMFGNEQLSRTPNVEYAKKLREGDRDTIIKLCRDIKLEIEKTRCIK